MQLAAAFITDTSSSTFQRAVASLPKNVTHCLIFDNTRAQHAQKAWSTLCHKPAFVLHHQGEIESFAEARNALLDVALEHNIDWVFFVDSDEVCFFDAKALEAALDAAQAGGECAIQLKRSDIFLNQVLFYGEAGKQPIVRMMRPSLCSYYGSTHEHVRVRGSILKSDLEIHHFAHASISDFIHAVSGYARRVGYEKQTDLVVIIYKMLFFPVGKWLYNVVFLQAWRDGWCGILYATIMSLHSLLVRVYQYEKNINSK